MNSAAAQCAIWHGLRGPNVTIAGGRAAVLLALRYALRLLAAGRATAVVCGGAEELTPERVWLEHHCGRSVPLGEGCAVLLIEPPGPDRPTLAEILAVEVRVCPAESWAGIYADCLRGALDRAGVCADEVWAVVPSGSAEWRETERRVVAEVLGEPRSPDLPDMETWGDAGAATTAFQIAALLAGDNDDAAGRVAAVMSVDASGVLGCAVLRIGRP
jgi:3-oxoacyl-[acyl-carrier-protein] synthase II